MSSQWKTSSGFTRVLSVLAALIIMGSVFGAVAIGLTSTDEVAIASAAPTLA
ncbi:MAG TPA: hypothetical protein VL593_03345 [Ramlibacter sp.]|jgi:hypothetical protein|nr:hypothetical protein [Ramlibacter sp.]